MSGSTSSTTSTLFVRALVRSSSTREDDDASRQIVAGMPHVQVAISMKTCYHRNPAHRWTTNDLVDIDALSVAYAYCDAVLTDKAARSALAHSTELRRIGTYLPRRPADLGLWLDRFPLRSCRTC